MSCHIDTTVIETIDSILGWDYPNMLTCLCRPRASESQSDGWNLFMVYLTDSRAFFLISCLYINLNIVQGALVLICWKPNPKYINAYLFNFAGEEIAESSKGKIWIESQAITNSNFKFCLVLVPDGIWICIVETRWYEVWNEASVFSMPISVCQFLLYLSNMLCEKNFIALILEGICFMLQLYMYFEECILVLDILCRVLNGGV
jgi:hypothetical protein